VKQISLKPSQVNQIEQETRGQSGKDLWFQIHEQHISASNVHEIYTSTKSLLQAASVDCTALISLCVNVRTMCNMTKKPSLRLLVHTLLFRAVHTVIVMLVSVGWWNAAIFVCSTRYCSKLWLLWSGPTGGQVSII